jgi:hypothetical protein
VRYSRDLEAPAPVVFALFTDEAFLSALARTVGATEHRADVQRTAPNTTCHLAMTISTAGIPQVFRGFVGETVEVTWVTTWGAPHDDGAYPGEVHVEASARRSARATGTVALTPTSATSCVYDVDTAPPDVDVPSFLKGQAAKQAERLMTKVLEDQVALTRARLSR